MHGLCSLDVSVVVLDARDGKRRQNGDRVELQEFSGETI